METHTDPGVVIVGASHAASQLCVSLRQGGYAGSVTVIGDEAVLPYHRPPLSKDFLSGNKSLDDIFLRPESVYETADIEMKLATRVGAIDRHAKTVLTDEGETVAYDKLVLCTGARVRRLPIAGEDLANVFYLRDSKDVLSIKSKVSAGRRAVIIGGGYIGLETAASLRQQAMEVTVLEAMPRILQRVTAPELSSFYKRIHREEGVDIREEVMASAIIESQSGLSVKTSTDEDFDADIVIIGIGVIPNVELAEVAGLDIGNGIAVNEFCQTSDPEIYAAGDVTWHHNPHYDCHLRLESVPNATEQAKTVGLHINGTEKPYDALPWFWSDQFDLKLQIAGLSDGYDELIIRGDIKGSRSFAAYYFKDGDLLAVDAVNAPRDFMFGRQVLTKGMELDRSRLADEVVPLKQLIL
ncbi:NAD(P)/FAD-dependent oxidoreductase [Litorimonas sp. WD9-15]|uniref:NAD(P)/FAD-dependent oxidoreductase n=1 Tax=Litorimonas sp. WD9-15 TaxID=3418716 RepID=UPI003D08A506